MRAALPRSRRTGRPVRGIRAGPHCAACAPTGIRSCTAAPGPAAGRPAHSAWNSAGNTTSRTPGPAYALPRRRGLGERLLQGGSRQPTTVPRVPVSGQPGHIASVDRGERPKYPRPPAHRRTDLSDYRSERPLPPGRLSAPCAVGEHPLAIGRPEHRLRSMRPHPARHMPPQSKRPGVPAR
ncbi:hypothetical protein STPH2_7536 [Streptomyces sp. KO7888]|nr:hypothetical protein [Streptomyces sp. KO7888]